MSVLHAQLTGQRPRLRRTPPQAAADTLKLDWQVMQGVEHGLHQIRVIVDVSDSQTVR